MIDVGQGGTSNNPEVESVFEVSILIPHDADPYNVITVEDVTFGPLTTSGEWFPTVGVPVQRDSLFLSSFSDTCDLAVLFSLSPGSSTMFGMAFIAYTADTNGERFVIRSYAVPNGVDTTDTDLIALERATPGSLVQAEADIRAALSELQISLGPQHNAHDGNIEVTFVTADYNPIVKNGAGEVDVKSQTWKPLRVLAIADQPFLTINQATPTCTDEDGYNIPLQFSVQASDDNHALDNSEVLSVQVEIPKATQYLPAESSTRLVPLNTTASCRPNVA